MASFEKLTDNPKSTRANMMKQMSDLDLLDEDDGKPAPPVKGNSPMSEGSRELPKKGPNKFTVPRKPGESLKDHAARVKMAREKVGDED